MEFFDKDKKTVDEALEKKLKVVYELENETRTYIRNVENFSNIIKGKDQL